MKYSTKKLLSIVMSITLLSGLTGCGYSTEEKAVETSATVVEEPKEIILWYTNDELSEFIEKAVSEYEEMNFVSITTKLVSGIDYIENINQAVLSEDSAPDLFIAENSNLEKIYLAGLSTDITQEVQSENDYYETAINAFTYKDKVLAYPLYFETSYLLYNTDYVQEAPSTIDDILAFSDTFDAPEGVESIFNWDVTDILCNYFFIGKYLNNEEINNENYITDKTKLTEALNYYQNLNQYFAIDAQTVDYETSFQNFIDGKSVFTIAKTDKLPEIEMIEGDVNEEVQTDSIAENNESYDANEEGSIEAEENEDSKSQDAKSDVQSSEETSKDDEKNDESVTKESGETSQSTNGLESYAGVEKVLRQIPLEVVEINEEEQEQSDTTPVQDSKYKVAALPNLSNDLESMGIAINYGVFVNGYSLETETAKAFARYLTYDNANTLYTQAGKLSLRSDLSYQSENITTILKQYETSAYAPKIMEDADFWLKLEIDFGNIWKGAEVDPIVEEMSK